MRAVAPYGVPVPAVPVICEDASIVGRPFVVMDMVDGDAFDVALATHGSAAVAASTLEALRCVHAVPRAHTGIGGDDALDLAGERARWTALMQRGDEEHTGAARMLERAMGSRPPAEREPTLVHGDYHYGNLLFDGSRVAAVLDWEIAQLGQPLLDLASLCVIAERRRFPDDPNPNGLVEITTEELIAAYGADPGEMRWYVALGCYKYAAIFAYNLGLHRRGKRVDPHYERLAPTIGGLIARGLELLS